MGLIVPGIVFMIIGYLVWPGAQASYQEMSAAHASNASLVLLIPLSAIGGGAVFVLVGIVATCQRARSSLGRRR